MLRRYHRDVRKRPLGKTGLEVSEVTLGTWGLAPGAYGPMDATRRTNTISRALERGITTFDTSPTWGAGACETALGEALRGKGDEVRVISRAGVDVSTDPPTRAVSGDALRRSVEASLARLERPRLDVLLLHGADEDTLAGRRWAKAMESLADEGLVTAWGASVGSAELALAAIDSGAQVVCMPYNLLFADDVHDIAEDLVSSGVGLLARSTLSYGLLAGHWVVPPSFGPDDHRRRRWSRPNLRTRIEHVSALRFLVHDEVRSMASAALRFVLANELISSAVVGPRGPTQVDGIVRALETVPPYLPDDDLRALPGALRDAGIGRPLDD